MYVLRHDEPGLGRGHVEGGVALGQGHPLGQGFRARELFFLRGYQ